MDYYVEKLSDVSVTSICEFETENLEGIKKYSRMIVEEGYRARIWYMFAKFGFIIERADFSYDAITMSEFKKICRYNSNIMDMYDKYKETKKEMDIFLRDKDVIYIKAQVASDLGQSNYDGSHCSRFYKLIGFKIKPRNKI